MITTYYYLMDGRANFDIDKAAVLETCDTIDEAMNSINNYGTDTCLVRVSNNNEQLLFSLLDDEVECFCSPIDTDDGTL